MGRRYRSRIGRLSGIAISVHCWQGDDVGGFERKSGSSGGGIQATGNHPGRARTPDELRADLDFAFANIPGQHRLNLHACYLDTVRNPGSRPDRIPPLHPLGGLGKGHGPWP